VEIKELSNDILHAQFEERTVPMVRIVKVGVPKKVVPPRISANVSVSNKSIV
jgi:hypothetical protein